MEHFKYFADPLHYAYLAPLGTKCDFCGSTEPAFDGGGFYGQMDVTAVCAKCLRGGGLAEIDVSTNELQSAASIEVNGGPSAVQSLRHQIERCTPALPTWQGGEWPVVEGECPVFMKIASQPDFKNKEDLFDAIPIELHFGRDADEFWEMLPESPITSIKDGNYDLSFYLFQGSSRKVCTWDCS